MTLSKHDLWVAERLAKKPKMMSEYLSVMLEQSEGDDGRALLRAINQVAKAQGMTKVAKAAGLKRESVSRALSGRSKPRIDTVIAILRGMGMHLTVQPLSPTKV